MWREEKEERNGREYSIIQSYVGGHIPTNASPFLFSASFIPPSSHFPPTPSSSSLPPFLSPSLLLSLLPTMSVDVSPLVLHLLFPMLSKVLPLPRVLPSTLPLSLARMRRLLRFNLLSAEIIIYNTWFMYIL